MDNLLDSSNMGYCNQLLACTTGFEDSKISKGCSQMLQRRTFAGVLEEFSIAVEFECI